MKHKPDETVIIKKSELQKMESVMEEGGAYQNAIQQIVSLIPSDYTVEDKVHYATHDGYPSESFQMALLIMFFAITNNQPS